MFGAMATQIYEIPLSATPQSFRISISGASYSLRFSYCAADQGGWLLDLSDSSGNALVSGIPLVTGSDLLAQYSYLGIGAALYVAGDGGSSDAPTFANLGTTTHLYVVTT